ncbi:hypothetical protein JCM3774_000168 [Rhodotorula dairenensis]
MAVAAAEDRADSHAPPEPTVGEIASAGAPNYAGRSLHPQVDIDRNGLMYIGPLAPPPPPFRKDPRTRTVSIPVKLAALAEKGAEQYHVRESDHSTRQTLRLAVGPELLLVQRRSVREDVRKDWLSVSARQVSYVKVTVNRWRHGQEGSDVLIAVVFKAADHPKELVLLLELDTHHRPDTLDVFDPIALEHIKAFFESWQQKDYCRTDIDRTRALAVPLAGHSLSSRPPVPEGYDPHDSATWVAPFGSVSVQQEALYVDEDKANANADAVATKADAAPGSRSRAEPGPSAPSRVAAAAAAFVVGASVGPDETPVVITQSGRTVKQRVTIVQPATDTDSDHVAEPPAARRKPAKRPRVARPGASSSSARAVASRSETPSSSSAGQAQRDEQAVQAWAEGMQIDAGADQKKTKKTNKAVRKQDSISRSSRSGSAEVTSRTRSGDKKGKRKAQPRDDADELQRQDRRMTPLVVSPDRVRKPTPPPPPPPRMLGQEPPLSTTEQQQQQQQQMDVAAGWLVELGTAWPTLAALPPLPLPPPTAGGVAEVWPVAGLPDARAGPDAYGQSLMTVRTDPGMEQRQPHERPSGADFPPEEAATHALQAGHNVDLDPGPGPGLDSGTRPRRRRSLNPPAHMQDYEVYAGARR